MALNPQITIRAEDDSGVAIPGTQVEVTDVAASTSQIYTVSDNDVWDSSTSTFIFDLPSNKEYQFEILNTPSEKVAFDEINGDYFPDSKTTLTVSDDKAITFVYGEETTCQIAYFDTGKTCMAGYVEHGWQICYGSDCTQTTCCNQRTCLSETDASFGSICEEYRPKADYSTITCGEGTGAVCSTELCCTTEILCQRSQRTLLTNVPPRLPF
ncbi:hypothetical protein SARC_08772 [Sphaeroforma arctica JP610]|uniref:Uncharacterized protein n=1 Tax=Sphaeroforma arctica JP610 TaxID=667725 RepID=A0A0L0FS49_9EUKA|nr:hypothetical protein SARC_08772 [Sphaeroforma arctica JP610]KNC78803.1 hypothetical protein SARC_08772 [Sphaeroforma arctica JP610]|eukprot:XP_014152705.1 hypothetical protein SARC_08772 [Sphaeroforma arctica JP610]